MRTEPLDGVRDEVSSKADACETMAISLSAIEDADDYGTIGAMPRATRGRNPTQSTDATDEAQESAGKKAANSDESELEWLYALDEGTEIAVTRKAPEFAEGFVGNVSHDPAAPTGILERIRSKWGGGRYLLQPKARQKNGHRYFAGGSARVTIAGEPMLDGRGYDEHGRHLPKVTAGTSPYPFPPYAPPASSPTPDVGQSQLLGIVERALSKGETNVDLAGVITALGGMQRDPPAPPAPVRVNTMADMKQMMEMMTLMRTNLGDAPESATAPTDPMERMMQMMMLKFMNGADAPSQSPFGNPAQTSSSKSPGPQPSPNHVWHPSRGWVLWKGHAEPPPRQQPQGPATPNDAPPPPTSPAEGHQPTNADSEGFIKPIVPDELIAELEAKTPAEQAEFVVKVLEMVEARPELAKVFQKIAEAATPKQEDPLTVVPS